MSDEQSSTISTFEISQSLDNILKSIHELDIPKQNSRSTSKRSSESKENIEEVTKVIDKELDKLKNVVDNFS